MLIRKEEHQMSNEEIVEKDEAISIEEDCEGFGEEN